MEAFKTHEIIPDVVSALPEQLLHVKFGQKDVNLGNEIEPKYVKEPPEVRYNADPNSFYTLILTDPDAPSRKNPTRREWHHWLVVNIPGPKVSESEILSEYVGSAPPQGSELHRYGFLLYKQPKKLTFDEPKHSDTDGKRGNFSAEKFAKKYDKVDTLIPVILLVAQTVCVNTSMSAEWKTRGVVPDVLEEVPPHKLTVEYPDVAIEEGTVIKPFQAKSPPCVSWEYGRGCFYTLCMIDADTPCRMKPIAKEWCHWLVVNIPEDDVDAGETIAEYVGPLPPWGNGFHRYIFLLYRQPCEIDCDCEKRLTDKTAEGRTLFSIAKFAETHAIGLPVAGNFFEAAFDTHEATSSSQEMYH
ncbi:hypothetical protein NQ318_003302 [Aromia moschata]|uniref:Phosphatidylethanolamine-binding protein n=1 Tax=Aromia moschata TaxID=1265417 RepID=A0AAV8YMN3_9CUCU|nr:hypothetical protein NQ318_003302 [Aromia moschata]